MFKSFLQSLKQFSPIEETEEGIIAFVNAKHLQKADDLIFLTETGIVIAVNELQFSKAVNE